MESRDGLEACAGGADDAGRRLGPGGWVVVALVWLYRVTLGQLMGGQCRYHPTCSQYMIDAVRRYGVWRGGWRGIRRVSRCHPWSKGGIDPA